MRRLSIAFTAATLVVIATCARAQPAPGPRGAAGSAARWQASLDAFAAQDRSTAPRAGGVLFVGSSSIRLWDGLESAFSDEPTIVKRGFGGSRLSDCAEFVDRLVLPYRPRLVVLYAGDNDLAEGATPQEVLERFDRFVAAVRRSLPTTRIAFLSIKPSPLRAALLPQARETNALIAARARTDAGLDYIDVFSPMLDAVGQPRADLYRADRLHLNAQGYALWRSVIAAHLAPPAASPVAASPVPASR